MKKRLISFSLLLIMLFSMLSGFGIASATETDTVAVPDDALYVDLSWTETTTPSTVTFCGKTTNLTWGTNAFATAQSALDAAESGDTVVLRPGTYGAMYIKKDITILGAKAGIDPNTKNATDELSPWMLSADRGSDETVVNGIIYLGVSGNTIYDSDVTITIDGIKMTGNGQLRSNGGGEGKAKLTFKNIYFKDSTSSTQPIYLFPFYGYDTNAYVKDVTMQNIRFEGQTVQSACVLSANKMDISGVFMGSDCTKVFASVFAAAKYTTGAANIEWNIHDNMFCNPVYRVIYADWDTATTPISGKTGVKSTIASYGKVTTTFENNYFLNCFTADDSAHLFAFRMNTNNVFYNFIGNTFYHTETPPDNNICLAGHSSASMAYASQLNIEKNRFIGEINRCYSFSFSTDSVDLSGNYYENKAGEAVSLTTNGNVTQDWWYMDRDCTVRSDAVADVINPEQMIDIENEIKWTGRTYSDSGKHYFNWTNSGFEVNFYGTGIYATLHSNNPGGKNTCYLKVYVDDVHTKTIILDSAEKTVTLANQLTPGHHTVRVAKRTNGRSSTAALSRLWVDEGTRIEPKNENSTRRIQFLGDSITVGYGALGVPASGSWETSTEDGTVTYAALTSEYFGADNHTVAISGRGVIWNTGGNKDTANHAPLMYEYDDWNTKGQWDHSKYRPDVVVINLGTNDNSSTKTTDDHTVFKNAVDSLLTQVRTANPDAYIIWAFGAMGDANNLEDDIEEMVAKHNAAGDTKISYLHLVEGEEYLGHPSAAAHQNLAELLIAEVTRVTGWTKWNEHSYSSSAIQEVSCKEIGITKYACALCGDVYTTETAKLTTHTPASEVIAYEGQEATCIATGLGYKDCTVCGTEVEKDIVIPIDKNNHSPAGEVIVDEAATCETEGVGHKLCSDCGEIGESGIVIPVDEDAHVAGSWVVTKKATYLKNGTKTKSCIYCGTLMKTAKVAKLKGEDTSEIFDDIQKKDWFYKNGAIDFVYNSGYFAGLNSVEFGPNDNMTRGMFVTVLGRLHGVKTKNISSETKFSDVESSLYYAKFVKWASDAGIVGGTSKTTFEPDANITREQICKIVIEYCNYAGVNLEVKNARINFKDASKISKWAKYYVEDCQMCGIINGEEVNGGYRFNPQGKATRAEVATIILNFAKNYL